MILMLSHMKAQVTNWEHFNYCNQHHMRYFYSLWAEEGFVIWAERSGEAALRLLGILVYTLRLCLCVCLCKGREWWQAIFSSPELRN